MKRPLFLTATLILTLSAHRAEAWCPFCEAPSQTLAEQIDQSAHLLLGKWVGGEKPTNESPGTSTFRILKVAKSRGNMFTAFNPENPDGNLLELPQYIAGKEEGLYILMGPEDKLVNWHVPRAATESSWKYLSNLPAPVTDEQQQIERLAYFLDYLEHPEINVANDAYSEFAMAPYETIKKLRDRMPREKICKWVMDPETPVTRMGLYGLLLGLCGNDEDAELMKQKILLPEGDFRLGIEGVMSGYLILTGEQGLEVLEESKMRASTYINEKGKEVRLPFSEVYAAMQTLRFMWVYEPDRIEKDRLRLSMRNMLERPELADIAIADLCRWKDWGLHQRLIEMYDDEKFNIPSVKRAIIRYFYTCSKAKPDDKSDSPPPEYAVAAEKHLKSFEERDPKTYRNVIRFMRRP